MLTEALSLVERRSETLERENKFLKLSLTGSTSSGGGQGNTAKQLSSSAAGIVTTTSSASSRQLSPSRSRPSGSDLAALLSPSSSSQPLDTSSRAEYIQAIEYQRKQASLWRLLSVPKLVSSLVPLPEISLFSTAEDEWLLSDDERKGRGDVATRIQALNAKYSDAQRIYRYNAIPLYYNTHVYILNKCNVSYT